MATHLSRSTRAPTAYDYDGHYTGSRNDDRYSYTSDDATLKHERRAHRPSDRARNRERPAQPRSERSPSRYSSPESTRPGQRRQSSYASHRSGTSSKRAHSEPRDNSARTGKLALAVGVAAIGAIWWYTRKQSERSRQQYDNDRRERFEREKARRRWEEDRREREQDWEEQRAEDHTAMSEGRRIEYVPSRSTSRHRQARGATNDGPSYTVSDRLRSPSCD